MPKPEVPIATLNIEKIFVYDLSRDSFTIELTQKGGALSGECFLVVCLRDAEDESDWEPPFVEGDSSFISLEFLNDTFDELIKWREEAGDHLGLFRG